MQHVQYVQYCKCNMWKFVQYVQNLKVWVWVSTGRGHTTLSLENMCNICNMYNTYNITCAIWAIYENMCNICTVWKLGYRWVQAGVHTTLSLEICARCAICTTWTICAEFESLGIGECRQGAHNAQSGQLTISHPTPRGEGALALVTERAFSSSCSSKPSSSPSSSFSTFSTFSSFYYF